MNNLFTYTPYIDAPHRRGHHCVGIYVKDGRGDSFARCPNAYFERCQNRNCSSWSFNNKQIQSVVSEFVDIIVFAIVYNTVD